VAALALTLSPFILALPCTQGEVTLTYEGLGGDPNALESGISWQAAVLEEVNSVSRPGTLTGEGGVTLQAIRISMRP
jgi:hypothetical protein